MIHNTKKGWKRGSVGKRKGRVMSKSEKKTEQVIKSPIKNRHIKNQFLPLVKREGEGEFKIPTISG